MKFTDAIKYSVKMLQSKEFLERVTEEDETMLKSMGIICDINKNGYLTIESQAGRTSKGVSVIDGKRYENIERAYITGYMLEEDAIKFIKEMNLTTDKNAVYIPICNGDVALPSTLDIPLTITKKEGKIVVDTHTSMVLPKYMGDFFRKQVKLSKTEKVVYIFCWDTKWKRNANSSNGLFVDILRILRKL